MANPGSTDRLIGVRQSLLVAAPLPGGDGYTWTLASRLGEMLALAEERYGPRDHSYTVLGVEFMAGIPQIWYPENRRYIVIQLSLECLTDKRRAYWQLAHECVHLLSPTGGGPATMLEEGLATLFAQEYMARTLGVPTSSTGMASYDDACGRVGALLALAPDAIRRLRAIEPTISHVSAALIRQVAPQVSEHEAYVLAAPFDRAGS